MKWWLTMSEEKWFLGRVSRKKAEELLNISGVDGSFVIRTSESIPGAYALSVLHNKTVHTYRILPTDDGKLGVQTQKGSQQRKFELLGDLVKDYWKPQNGLATGLTNPIGLDILTTDKSSLHGQPIHKSSNEKIPCENEPTSPASRIEALPLPPVPVVAAPSSQNIGPPIGNNAVKPTEISPCVLAKKRTESDTPPPLPPARRSPSSVATTKSQALCCDTVKPATKEDKAKAKLLSRLNEIKAIWSGTNTSFLEAVQQYTTEGGFDADCTSINRGEQQCLQLQSMLAREAVDFQNELQNFLMKIDILRQLFDQSSSPSLSRTSYKTTQDTDVDFDTFLTRLGSCQTVVKHINRRACINLQELLGVNPTPVERTRPPKKRHRKAENDSERTFEVKQEGAMMFTKLKLKIHVEKGTLSVLKPDGTTVTAYDHTKVEDLKLVDGRQGSQSSCPSSVLQLVKSNKSKYKLCIVFEGNKKRDYSFEKSDQREAFCQLMQYVRNKHCIVTEPDCVSIFCGSWNMGDSIPPSDISSWFLCMGSGKCLDQTMQGVPHDIYVVGTQETGLPEKEWSNKVMETIQDITETSFHLVAMDALWHIKIMIIVKEEHRNRISHVQTSSVRTGIANALGNKGAVAISFQFGGTSFCFINAHLTSGSEKCVRRNQNYHDIIRSLNLGEDRFRSFDLTNRFDHLYFLGDLNYRLEMDVKDIIEHIKRNEVEILFEVDQLKREKGLNKVFLGFDEEEIQFPPTYRYERGTRETYAYRKMKKTGIKINTPSWCDRVLWRSYPETHNVCHAYGCSDDIMTSDHSPLFSTFHVGVRSQYASNQDISNSSVSHVQASINFNEVKVWLKSGVKGSFYLQIHSVCLTKFVKSFKKSTVESVDSGNNRMKIVWNADSIPQLTPIVSDREYLVDQHILISVRSEDDHEIHGECVVSLRKMVASYPQTFEGDLTRKGENTGQILASMRVMTGDSVAPKEKTYDFIRRDDDITKSHMIEEAVYSDLDEVKQLADSKRHSEPNAMKTTSLVFKQPQSVLPVRRTVSVESTRIEANTRNAVEREYAVPDEVRSVPKTKISAQQSIQNVLAVFVGTQKPLGSSPRKGSPVDGSSLSVTNVSKDTHLKMMTEMEVAAKKLLQSRSLPVSRKNSNASGSPPQAPKRSRSSALMPPTGKSNARSRSPMPVLEGALLQLTQAEKTVEQTCHKGSLPNLHHDFPPSPVSSEDSKYNSLHDTTNFLRPGRGTKNASNALDTSLAQLTTKSLKFSSPSDGAQQQQSDGRGYPATVNEFLAMVNLPQYSELLVKNGWDDLEFLSAMTEEDLEICGVSNPFHCRTILETIESLQL